MSQEVNGQEFTYEEMQKALALHVWKNDHLREEIIKNPKATIERDLNVKFDEGIKLNIVNHTEPNQITFVLPFNINDLLGRKLSDSELEEVAGGGINMRAFFQGIRFEKIGKTAGDLAGSGLQIGGKMLLGVELPDTGLGKKLGGMAGKGLDNIFR